MLYGIIFVFLVGFVLVKSAEHGPPEITFKINPIKTYTEDKGNVTELSCDHNADSMLQNKYTVSEGEEFKIITKYNFFINHLICNEYNNGKEFKNTRKGGGYKNVTSFKVDKTMGNLWNCTVLVHHNSPTMLPVVHYKDANYTAAHCFMQIHVRQTKSPQTILVNNMVLEAGRTDLSEKDVDFTGEYQYVVGDVVNVACINFLKYAAALMMEYEMAGTFSDNSIMKDLESDRAITLVATLHSGHNNSYMICTNKEPTDYTKVMVRFVMLTGYKLQDSSNIDTAQLSAASMCVRFFNHIVSVNINGMNLRPKLKVPENHNYAIEYKYLVNQPIKVVCEVQRTDAILSVMDIFGLSHKVSSNKKTELIPNKKAMMSFCIEPKDDKKLKCWSDYTTGPVAEQVDMHFTAGDFPLDQYSLNMELPSNGTAMELYNSENKLKVIFYDFEDNETLQLKCGPLRFSKPLGPVVYLQLNDSDRCNTDGCIISKTLHVTNQAEEISCYLIRQPKVKPTIHDKVLREIRVILRKRVRTTTTSSTTSTTTSTPTTPTTGYGTYAETSTASNSSTALPPAALLTATKVPVIAGAAFCIIIICVAAVIVKLRKRNHSQGGPHDRNYRNLQTPSEASIPASPPQWESNYAVPMDRRPEDTTYSVPCQEPALYSTPTPKNLRNKKENKKPVDSTYAVLEVPNARSQKNIFKETDDPNYSEVYANRQEQCYAKVLSKSVRNKLAQDNNPYSYVTNEPAYANTAEPEPMYCEPAKAPGGTYANLNNSHYANSNAQEYVEPTYCEPQKRMK